MEPVKGGNLVNLPEDAKAVLDELVRRQPGKLCDPFCSRIPGYDDGTFRHEQHGADDDNLSYMKDFQPLNEAELAAVKKVQEIFKSKNLIPCTACRYCIDGCPETHLHPDLVSGS